MRVLGLETSCDETAAAVVDHLGRSALRRGAQPDRRCTRPTAASCRRSPRAITRGPSRPSCTEALAQRRARPARRGRDRRDIAAPGSRARCSWACRWRRGSRGPPRSRSSGSITSWGTCSPSSCSGAGARRPCRSTRSSRCSCRAGTPRFTASTGPSSRTSTRSARRATTPRGRRSTRWGSSSASAIRAARVVDRLAAQGDAARAGDHAAARDVGSATRSSSASRASRARWRATSRARRAAGRGGVKDLCAAFQATVVDVAREQDCARGGQRAASRASCRGRRGGEPGPARADERGVREGGRSASSSRPSRAARTTRR
jgi:hypothetical protein